MSVPWRPLAGMTVIDLTRMLPGGTGTLLLSDLGAEVVKIEQPPGGDATRWLEPRVGTDSSAQHQYMDRGKTAVSLDLKTDAGRAELFDLVRGADALVESFRPGVAARLGIGHDVLAEINPALVYLALSGYGQEGPRASAAGHDLNFVARAGLLGAGRDVPPTLVADVTGGVLAALGLTAGVLAARETGRGAFIDLALADAALVLGGMQIAERLASRRLDVPVATPLDGRSPCYQVYATSDGRHLAVAAVEEKFWQRVVTILGHPEWAARQTDPALVADVAAVVATKPLAQWLLELDLPDTCVSGVLDIDDLPTDPQVRERGSLLEVETAAGPLWQVAPPFHGRENTISSPPRRSLEVPT
ncbi:CoA transferase [Aeromicrobium sp. SMF47]|uniref:CaiB/BaiF CoA transferase family protein n=1 Tax=Aeromicrobium yanjiei TaxID=2662028 RepID=UPI00129EEE18|nr:CaiB/BaiF CoA-transferase family protein [Aeromicrobium yanjiei]MRJ75122.1 CoA transferase [Aeromicrobium yanjiei]